MSLLQHEMSLGKRGLNIKIELDDHSDQLKLSIDKIKWQPRDCQKDLLIDAVLFYLYLVSLVKAILLLFCFPSSCLITPTEKLFGKNGQYFPKPKIIDNSVYDHGAGKHPIYLERIVYGIVWYIK